MPTVISENINKCVEICLNVSKGKININDDGDINRRLLISPEFLLEYISSYCLETIESIQKLYDENDHLYSNANDFISTFILNINDEQERKMFYDFMWNADNLRYKIMSLASEDKIPYPSHIHGFKLEIMEHSLRDSWQCIFLINDCIYGSGLDINNTICEINLDDII